MGIAEIFRQAAAAIKSASTLVITAGAGMGVDSGLPDFRGDHGFWRAYPLYEQLGINFFAAANPAHFEQDPAFGWGFYGHRTNLYRTTIPHAGFGILLDWIARFRLDYFVVTSNVDGQFQKGGFAADRIHEVHGSIHFLQCTRPCTKAIWENRDAIPLDPATMRAQLIPACISCGGVARPNILMFGDSSWLSDRTAQQDERFDTFQHRSQEPMVVVELGAGTAIPTIRSLSERLGSRSNTTVIRINPREPQIAPPHIALATGALSGLLQINSALKTQ